MSCYGGVLSLRSRKDITLSGSYRIRPAALNPELIFYSVKAALNVALKAGRNSSLLM
jgi:hypothetical protein